MTHCDANMLMNFTSLRVECARTYVNLQLLLSIYSW